MKSIQGYDCSEVLEGLRSPASIRGIERIKELSKSAFGHASSQDDREQGIAEVALTATGDAPGPDRAPALAGPARDGAAAYCKVCALWLNGRTQMEDHKIGKKHRKKARVAGTDKWRRG